MKKKILFAFLFLSVLAGGYGPAAAQAAKPNPFSPLTYRDLLVNGDFSSNPQKALTPEELEKDKKVLLYSLVRGYPGAFLMRNGFFSETIRKIGNVYCPASLPCTVKDMCDQLAEAVYDIPDKHMFMSAGEKEPPCGRSYNEQASDVSHVGRNLHRDTSKKVWEIYWQRAGDKNIPVLSLPLFRVPNPKKWDGMAEALQSALVSAPALIIDLRGNMGGQDEGIRIAAKVLYGQDAPLALRRTTFIKTPEAMALKVNYADMELYYSSAAHSPDLKLYEMKLKKSKEELARVLARNTEQPFSRNDFKQVELRKDAKMFDKPIYILVDRVCASACEMAVLYMKRHPYAKTAGERTAGDLVSNQTSIAILPNSRMRIWFGDVYRDFYGDVKEREGLEPDIKIPRELDALQYMLDIMTKE